MIINPFDNEQEFTSSDKLITHLTQLAVDKNNVFRGYGKQSELFPNIIREKDWREQEIRLPDFDIHAYGFSKLYDLIASFPDKYEIKKDDKNHAVPVALYRCK